MGFWKKLGGFLGRTAITAAAGALEAKASGKPITIGTVGPGVLGDVLRRSEEPVEVPVESWEGDVLPKCVGEGWLCVRYWAERSDGRWGRIRYFDNVEQALKFATKVGSSVVQAANTGNGLIWVPLRKAG
jgi:hypothetical protein